MSLIVYMSLDDIIKANKYFFKKFASPPPGIKKSASTSGIKKCASTSGIKKSASAPPGIKKRGSFKGRISSTGNTAKTTNRRRSGRARRASQRFSCQDKRVNDNTRAARVHISNLAASVLSSDLAELFKNFNPRRVMVNFNETGDSLGTAELTLSKANADCLIKMYTNAKLDGKVFKFGLIDTSIATRAFSVLPTNFPLRTNFPAQKIQEVPKTTISSGFKAKKDAPNKQNSGRGKTGAKKSNKKRQQKLKKTVEELDAELDAYMSRI